MLGETGIEQLLGGDSPLLAAPLVWYRPDAAGNMRDLSGLLPDLKTTGAECVASIDHTVLLSQQCRLQTPAPAAELSRRLQKACRFTLSIKLSTEDTDQRGPARIVTLSKDPGHRNFTLGQQGPDFVFRLRTPLTGLNGVMPELVVPGIFDRTDFQTLVITYDGATLRLYHNQIDDSHGMTFESRPDLVRSAVSRFGRLPEDLQHSLFVACVSALRRFVVSAGLDNAAGHDSKDPVPGCNDHRLASGCRGRALSAQWQASASLQCAGWNGTYRCRGSYPHNPSWFAPCARAYPAI